VVRFYLKCGGFPVEWRERRQVMRSGSRSEITQKT
jgi:hypothetical protein